MLDKYIPNFYQNVNKFFTDGENDSGRFTKALILLKEVTSSIDPKAANDIFSPSTMGLL